MASWFELEKKFLELEPALRFARLDRATSSAGEYWDVKAVSDPVARTRFESLATMAGRKLATIFTFESLPDELRNAPNDRSRWYHFLCKHHQFYEQMHHYGIESNGQGKKRIWLYGSVANLAEASAACCLEVASMCPDDEKPAGQTIVNVSGQNARLNVGSIDNSTNIVSASETEIFEDIRKVVEEKIVSERQGELLARLHALELAVNTPSYLDRYKEFIQVAANHATLLAPFLPALANLLQR